MSENDPKQSQDITPSGQVELDENELDQVTGGVGGFDGKATDVVTEEIASVRGDSSKDANLFETWPAKWKVDR